jgi:hypothetical protein
MRREKLESRLDLTWAGRLHFSAPENHLVVKAGAQTEAWYMCQEKAPTLFGKLFEVN